jgi:crotonobetainyl-CoA:carnitine CoA-transferase CaiB-like acyl-CoA transferase
MSAWLETTVGMDRNKRNMSLNLKSPEGKEIFLQMVREADVVIDGMRPGATARLGIDYDTLEKLNPRLVYVSVSGYGRESPLRRQAGHDLNYLALAGLLPLLGNLDAKSRFLPLVSIADAVAGVYGAMGAFVALLARARTGEGQLVDVAYVDSVLSWGMTFVLQEQAIGGLSELPAPMTSGYFPFYDVYETSDGKLVSIGCIEPWFWENLCNTLSVPEFIPLAFSAEDRVRIKEELGRVFRTKTRDEWDAVFLGSPIDVCYAPVMEPDEALASPLVREREMAVEVERPGGRVTEIGIPIKLSKTPGRIERGDPKFGQDTAEVLRGLGISDERMAELRERGVID